MHLFTAADYIRSIAPCDVSFFPLKNRTTKRETIWLQGAFAARELAMGFFLGSVSCYFNGLLPPREREKVGRYCQGTTSTPWRVKGKRMLLFAGEGCVAVRLAARLQVEESCHQSCCWTWRLVTPDPGRRSNLRGSRCCSLMDCEEQRGQGVRWGTEQTAVPGAALREPLETPLRSLRSPPPHTLCERATARC